jgi:hypothetical protein
MSDLIGVAVGGALALCGGIATQLAYADPFGDLDNDRGIAAFPFETAAGWANVDSAMRVVCEIATV